MNGPHMAVSGQSQPPTGSRDARAFVGPADHFDRSAAVQFNLLTTLGLREGDHLLDIGCGSLRAGRLFLVYLAPGNYCGLEPEKWLVEAGIDEELGWELVRRRQPEFRYDEDFGLQRFERQFDYLLAQSIFSHASQDQIRTCLAEAARVLRPTGLFCATFLPGDTSYQGDAWVYPGNVTYTPRRVRELVAEAGLACRMLDWPHPSGQKWVLIRHTDHEPDLPRAGSVVDLEWRLRETQKALSRLNMHPWVRIGRQISRTLRRITQLFR